MDTATFNLMKVSSHRVMSVENRGERKWGISLTNEEREKEREGEREREIERERKRERQLLLLLNG